MPSLPSHLYLAIRDVDSERDGAPVVPESGWDERALVVTGNSSVLSRPWAV